MAPGDPPESGDSTGSQAASLPANVSASSGSSVRPSPGTGVATSTGGAHTGSLTESTFDPGGKSVSGSTEDRQSPAAEPEEAQEPAGARAATGRSVTVVSRDGLTAPASTSDTSDTSGTAERPGDRSNVSKRLPGVHRHMTDPTSSADPDVVRAPSLRPDAVRSTRSFDPEPAPTVTARSVAVAIDRHEASAPDTLQPQRAQPTAAAPRDPIGVVTAAIAGVVNSIVNPFAGSTPETPVEPPWTWALLAFARRERIGAAPAVATMLNPVAVATEPVVAQTDTVSAIPQTPPLAALQEMPIVGPALVTPIVAGIHQVPVIGDMLHPLIGYPVQIGSPAGAPAPRDVMVTSFDGTPIYTHFMPATGLAPGQTAPTIFMGPGLGELGSTNAYSESLSGNSAGGVDILQLRQAGYNVVTWDPRGSGRSGGELQIDDPAFEGRDVSSIVSWVAQQPEAQLDAAGDPRMGMVGASYGGGIQLVTAARDHRVDAIVPTVAWNSLNSSLYKNDAVKTAWGAILSATLLGSGANVNPQIYDMVVRGALTGMLNPADEEFLAERGPDYLLEDINAPTMLVGGTVDTLFTLQETHDTAVVLMDNGVPVKVMWSCGGHGVCDTGSTDTTVVEQRTLQWLDRYVKGDESVSTGPQFEWVDQHGQWLASDAYPVVQGPALLASTNSAGTLALVPVLGGSLPGFVFGNRAINALNLEVPAPSTTTHIVGAPELTLTYSGIGTSRHVYAQLVDDTTGLVLGSQVTPMPVTLDGQTHTVTIPLEQVAHTLKPGETVSLQLVPSAGTYVTPWGAGVLNVSNMQLSLPTAADVSAASAAKGIEVGFWAGEERLDDGGQPAPIDGDAYWAPRDLSQFTPELWDVLERNETPVYFNMRYMRDFGPVPEGRGPYNELLPIMQEANARGVPIWGWVTVPPDDGYFAHEGGAAIQQEAIASAEDWMAANGVAVAGYVVDVEPPARIISDLREVQAGNFLGLFEIYADAINPAKQRQGWDDYVALVDWAHARGLKVAATAPPFAIDDNNDGTMALQDATDVILPPADWDGVFIQAYRNELDMFGDPGPGIVHSYFTSARHQYGSAADISIGTPGETGYLDAASMVKDIRLLATLGGRHVPVYTLERTAEQFGPAGIEQIVTQVAPYTGWEAVAAQANVISPLVFLQRGVLELMDVLATVMTPVVTTAQGNPQLPNTFPPIRV